MQIDCLASAVLSSVFIPPMPLVSLKGEKGEFEETCASSHDLLNRVIAVHAMEQKWEQDLAADLRKKQTVLFKMHEAICSVVRQESASGVDIPVHALVQDPDLLETCYTIFQKAFREYMATYCMTHNDVRIAPMDVVGKDHVIIQQGKEHIHAIEQGFDDGRVRPDLSNVTSYKHIVALYVEMLASMTQD